MEAAFAVFDKDMDGKALCELASVVSIPRKKICFWQEAPCGFACSCAILLGLRQVSLQDFADYFALGEVEEVSVSDAILLRLQ